MEESMSATADLCSDVTLDPTLDLAQFQGLCF